MSDIQNSCILLVASATFATLALGCAFGAPSRQEEMLRFLDDTTANLNSLAADLEVTNNRRTFAALEKDVSGSLRRLRQLTDSLPKIMALPNGKKDSALPDLGQALKGLRAAVARLTVAVNKLPFEVKQSSFFQECSVEITMIGKSLSSLGKGKPAMTADDLKKKLDEAGVDTDVYCLNGGLPNEEHCLERLEDGTWRTYYSERGRRTSIQIFDNENDACEFFFEWLGEFKKRQ